MRDSRQDLLDSVQAALAMNGIPLTARPVATGCPGAAVRIERHGVSVYWNQGTGAPKPRDDARAHRAMGGASLASPVFTATLHLAAVLADAGYHSEHLGNRVLVSQRP